MGSPGFECRVARGRIFDRDENGFGRVVEDVCCRPARIMGLLWTAEMSCPIRDRPGSRMGSTGLSRVVDFSRFEWSDGRWQAPPFSSSVVYELHVGTFTPEGTFDSAIARLRYLADLGITHVELMPVNEFPGDWGWGYDGVDLFAPHHAYGGPVGLKRLIDACHARGLAVMMDVVYNHLGPAGNYLGRFGPYFTRNIRRRGARR